MLNWFICKNKWERQAEAVVINEMNKNSIQKMIQSYNCTGYKYLLRTFSGYPMLVESEAFEEYYEQIDLAEEDLMLWRTLPISCRYRYTSVEDCIKEAKEDLYWQSVDCSRYYRVYTNEYNGIFLLREVAKGYEMISAESKQKRDITEEYFKELGLYLDIDNAGRMYLLEGNYSTITVPKQVKEIHCIGDVKISGHINMENTFLKICGDSLTIDEPEALYPLVGNIESKDGRQMFPRIETKVFEYLPKDKKFKWGCPFLPYWYINDSMVIKTKEG